MPKCIKLNNIDDVKVNEIGLLPSALNQIYLGSETDLPPHTVDHCPGWAKHFIAREFRGSGHIFSSLQDEALSVPDPRTGRIVSLNYSFASTVTSGGKIVVFDVFGDGEDTFCLVYAGLVSRVTHIILPHAETVVFDLDERSVPFVWAAYNNHLEALNYLKPRSLRSKIGVIDMHANYAHQVMNYLSGLHRLVELGLEESLDEIWIFGVEFFGEIEHIIPELRKKIRRINRVEALDKLRSGEFLITKIGSNFLTNNLRDRILDLARQIYRQPKTIDRWPILLVTTRSSGRRCNNLPQVVQEIVDELSGKFPNIGIIIDGWVFPESAIVAKSSVVTSLMDSNVTRLREEAKESRLIAELLPKGVLVANLVGFSMLESLLVLSMVDIYFSHVGTLQHKIGWFSEARGIVHGPIKELKRMETSYYASESCDLPLFLGVENVEDDYSDYPVEADSQNYRIRGAPKIAKDLEALLMGNTQPPRAPGGRGAS